MTIAEREQAHLIVLAHALGMTVGELVWAGWKAEDGREWERFHAARLSNEQYFRPTAA